MKLHLGCGDDRIEGFVNVDFDKAANPDQVADLNGTWPWDDNSVSYIITKHTAEHLDSTVSFLKEVCRVCKNNAIVEITVPYFACRTAFCDPTHKQFFSYSTLDNWDISLHDTYRTRYNVDIQYLIIEKKFSFLGNEYGLKKAINALVNPFVNLVPRVYERFISPFFPCTEIYYKFKVVKE